MAIWNKLRSELDRAGRAAHDALDEGKLRLEVFRARQLVDRAAQALGYAVYRSRTGLEAADDAALARLTDAVRDREQEVAAMEDRLRQATRRQPAPDPPAPEQPAPEQPAPEQPAPEQPAPEQPAAAHPADPPPTSTAPSSEASRTP